MIESFGEIGGIKIKRYVLANKNKMQVKILNYGGLINSIIVPDRYGNFRNVALGFETIEGYVAGRSSYIGSLVGRYSNRIANASFVLNGETYTLPANNGKNCLHGGAKGFDQYIWKTEETIDGLRLLITSPDGDQGFPGNLQVEVNYVLNDDNSLRIMYRAITDKSTPVNLTNHAYFNLSGGADDTILDHQMQLNADSFIEPDKDLIPTGNIMPVSGTALDFRTSKKIGQDINTIPGGFDHSWVLNNSGELKHAASLYNEKSGILMHVETTEPGIQFYSGNFLDGSLTGHNGKKYSKHSGLCLETQHFPDSPNRPEFPSTILNPKQIFRSETIYKFEVQSTP